MVVSSRHDIGSSHAGNASSASSATKIFYFRKSNDLCKEQHNFDDLSQLRDITLNRREMIALRPIGAIGPILVKLKSWVAVFFRCQAHDSIVINVARS